MMTAAPFILLFCATLLVALRICFRLPRQPSRPDVHWFPERAGSALAREVGMLAARHPGRTGVAALPDGPGAFAARAALIDAAEVSIDAQYYIWGDDLTGTMLLDALRRAAARGVRVRLLLDDNGIPGLDELLAQLDRSPQVEVRLFNPFVLRAPKWLNYLFAPLRLNRRMHNKSLSVDGVATIVGGRNVADAYFGTGDAALFVDLDVLAIGRIVPEVTADFECYWRAEAVHPAAAILPVPAAPDPIGARAAWAAADPTAERFRAALAASQIAAQLRNRTLPFVWTRADLVSDHPRKGIGRARDEDLMMTRLTRLVGRPKQRLDLVSPYFVPGSEGAAAFTAMRGAGVEVRVLTNALEATDVVAVHAGYARRRTDLLAAGVRLYELKRSAPAAPDGADAEMMGPFGSSGGSLHAKTFAIDERAVYVGSFNFDPRSLRLNTEMGLVIHDAGLARRLHAAFDDRLGVVAFRPTIRAGRLVWQDGATVHGAEPGADLGKRFLLIVVSRLPVEWLL